MIDSIMIVAGVATLLFAVIVTSVISFVRLELRDRRRAEALRRDPRVARAVERATGLVPANTADSESGDTQPIPALKDHRTWERTAVDTDARKITMSWRDW